jgi:hypothetical protein
MKACNRCGRINSQQARFCDMCNVIFPPFPPAPSPTNGTKEISRFWLALGLIGATFGAIALAVRFPDALTFWQFIIGSLLATTGSAINWYFGTKSGEAVKR